MIKETIKYTNFDEEEVEGDFYFNITKTELLDIEVEHQEGLEDWIMKVIRAKDHKTMWEEFKRIVLLAYGEKSPDGERFVKTPEISEAFSHHAAFDAFMMKLVTDDDYAARFIKGVIPKDLATKMDEETAKPADAPTT